MQSLFHHNLAFIFHKMLIFLKNITFFLGFLDRIFWSLPINLSNQIIENLEKMYINFEMDI